MKNKVINYVAILNNEGLVFIQTEPHEEISNPDSIDVDEDSNKIIFTKGDSSIILENIKEDIKNAIILDNGFDIYEIDENAEPISNYRYGSVHKPKINKNKNGL